MNPTHAPSPHLFTARTLCGTTGPRHHDPMQVSCGDCRLILLGEEAE